MTLTLTLTLTLSLSPLTSHPEQVLGDRHIKMLNLAADWLSHLLPHALRKVDPNPNPNPDPDPTTHTYTITHTITHHSYHRSCDSCYLVITPPR